MNEKVLPRFKEKIMKGYGLKDKTGIVFRNNPSGCAFVPIPIQTTFLFFLFFFSLFTKSNILKRWRVKPVPCNAMQYLFEFIVTIKVQKSPIPQPIFHIIQPLLLFIFKAIFIRFYFSLYSNIIDQETK